MKGEVNLPENENKEVTLRTSVDPDLKVLFSDGVNLEVDNEAIVFNFIKTLPGEPEKTGNDEYIKDATVVTRVAITTPNFRRFLKMCNELVEKLDSLESQ